jgi:hypothetical protein
LVKNDYKMRCYECGKEFKDIDDCRSLPVAKSRVLRHICTKCLLEKYPDVYATQIEAEKRWIEETAARKQKRLEEQEEQKRRRVS